MAGAERLDAFALMRAFHDDEAALGDALALFVERPDYGFVWLAYDDGVAAACLSVAFAVAAETGGLAAILRDVWVRPEHRGKGVGSALLATVHGKLDQLGVRRIEAAVPEDDGGLRALFGARGYAAARTTLVTLDR